MKSELPEGWTRCRVEDLFCSFSGGTPSKNNRSYWGGKIPWLSSGDIKAGRVSVGSEFITQAGLENSSSRLCRPGSVLIVVRSGVLKHTLPVSVLAQEAAINQDIKCFDSGRDDVNIWLALALRAFSKDILALNREGTTVQSVKYDTLRHFPLPIPPLPEQKRTAERLEKLLAEVEQCKERMAKIPVLLKRFRQSVLAAACSGRLTAAWRERSPQIEDASALLKRIRAMRSKSAETTKEKNQIEEAFSDDLTLSEEAIRLDELPNSWKICRIGMIGTVVNGSTPSRKHGDYWQGDIPWASSGEVRNNIITDTREKITKAGFDSCSVRLLSPGTVLLAMIGEGKTRGQSAILRIRATINQNIAAILLSHGMVSPEFLWRWFQFQYEATRERGSGSGPQALNCQRVRELPFVLAPITEQQEIVRRVDALFALADRIEEQYEKAKMQVDALTQSILAKAFRGELVPTEAELAAREGRAYESAAQLLERIRAGKTGNETGGGKRAVRKRRAV